MGIKLRVNFKCRHYYTRNNRAVSTKSVGDCRADAILSGLAEYDAQKDRMVKDVYERANEALRVMKDCRQGKEGP